jgi:hypothetical protein
MTRKRMVIIMMNIVEYIEKLGIITGKFDRYDTLRQVVHDNDDYDD